MSFPVDFFEHLKKHNYTEIKGGVNRKSFLEIWVVAVGDRVFARSWNKSEKSWFTAFLEYGVGELKYGDNIISVKGKKLDKQAEIHNQIDQAYLTRYNEGENIFYAKGISQPEYADYTMEFFYNEQ
jgi:hypothetical protein